MNINKTERDRLRKRKQRINLSEHSKNKVREYDRNRKRLVRDRQQKIEVEKIHKMQEKFRKCEVPTSETFKESATKLLMHGLKSPNKKEFIVKYLQEKGLIGVNSKEQKRFSVLKLKSYKLQKRHKDHKAMVDEIRMHYGSINKAAKALNQNLRTFYKLCQPVAKPVHKRTVQKELNKEKISNFFDLKATTISFPHARIAKKKFMTSTYDESYRKYKRWCVQKGYVAVSSKTFHRLKPANIYKLADTPENQCTCILCQNFKKDRKCIEDNQIKGVAKHSNEIILDSLCPVTDGDMGVMPEYGKYSCISRSCSTCGFIKKGNKRMRSDYYENKIKFANRNIYLDQRIVKWQRWEFVTRISKDGKEIKKLDKVDKFGTRKQFLQVFFQDVHDMALHLFNWKWHDTQFDYLKEKLEPGMLAQVLDFAQNYMNIYVDEPQGCHWDHTQTVIHPIVNYRICPKDGQLIVEEHIIISDDLIHDKFAVKKFEQTSVSNIESEEGFKPKCIVQFCDNCSKQYKSKGPFQYISTSGVPTVRNYFGANHGKGPSDAATGRVKKDLNQARKSRQYELRTAHEVYIFLKENFAKRMQNQIEKNPNKCVHFKQKAFYVTDIDRSDDIVAVTTKTSKQFSSIRNTGHDYIIEARNVACCCPNCIFGDVTVCPNKHYSGSWVQYDLRTGKKVKHPVDSHWLNLNEESANCQNNNRQGNLENENCNPFEQSVSNTIQSRVSNSPRMNNVALFPEQMQFNWDKLRNDVATCNNFSELYNVVDKQVLPPFNCIPARLEEFHTVDTLALKHLPEDAPKDYIPVAIYGDGNCCPRALCVAMGLNPDVFHTEMRLRILKEGVSNKKRYLTDGYLSKGCVNKYTKTTFPIIYADMSEYRQPFPRMENETLVERLMRWSTIATSIYKEETFMSRKSGEWMGMWQLFQASNVINRPIYSVYPQWLSSKMRMDLNRVIYPFEECQRTNTPIYIMWTSTNSQRNPNHFVPLLPS